MSIKFFNGQSLLYYEYMFGTPYDLLIAPGLSAQAKQAMLDLWSRQRMTYLYAHGNEMGWDSDGVILEIDICADILCENEHASIFREIEKFGLPKSPQKSLQKPDR